MAQIDLIKEFGKYDAETFNKISKGYSMGEKDGIRKFAEWLCKKSDIAYVSYVDFMTAAQDLKSIEEVIAEYSKEQEE